MSSFVGINLREGFPGAISRAGSNNTVEVKAVKGGQAVEYGQAVKLNDDGTVEAAKNTDAVLGVVVREFHQEGADKQKFVSVLTRGYVFVPVEKGSYKVGAQIHLSAAGKFAAEDGTAIAASRVMGEVKDDLVEIAFNI